jgi:hypothetical protein
MNNIEKATGLVAQDAIFELCVCRIALQQVYSLIGLVKPKLTTGSDALRALEMAEAYVEGVSSNAEAAEENLEARLGELAPQNANLPVRGAEASQ